MRMGVAPPRIERRWANKRERRAEVCGGPTLRRNTAKQMGMHVPGPLQSTCKDERRPQSDSKVVF
jgi:hypothetical protein